VTIEPRSSRYRRRQINHLATDGVLAKDSRPLARIRSPRPLTVNVIRTEAKLAAPEGEAENTNMSSVRMEVRSLSVRDRLRLLEEIWDSLAETPEAIPVTDAQRKELARRRRVHARNPSAAKSWAEVRASLRRRK
jgi:putative addiction module component (TIGR02574 family)